jgi:hypothetical protein
VGCPVDDVVADGTDCQAVSACIKGGVCGAGSCAGGVPEMAFTPAEPALSNEAQEVAVTVKHSGTRAPIIIRGVSATPEGTFNIVAQPPWPVELATGDEAVVRVRIVNLQAGRFEGELRFDADGCQELTVPLKAELYNVKPDRLPGCAHVPAGLDALLPSALLLAPFVLRRRRP